MKRIFLVSLFIFLIFGTTSSVFAQFGCNFNTICEPVFPADESCQFCAVDCDCSTIGKVCGVFGDPANDVWGCIASPAVCGNDICEAGEDCLTCVDCATCATCDPADPLADASGCISSVSNGVCEWGETCLHPDCACVAPDICEKDQTNPVFWLSCITPSICGNDICEAGEDCLTCVDCATCATCDPADPLADASGCISSVSNGVCEWGETCLHPDCACVAPDICEKDQTNPVFWLNCVTPPICNNDGICDHAVPGVEDCTNCFDCDCGAGTCNPVGPGADPDTGCIPPCGNGVLDPGENCQICYWDSPCPGGYNCDPSDAAADPVTGCVPPPIPPDEGLDPPINATTFEELIYNITNTIFYFALILGPILFLIAGFYFITAGENPSRVARAKYIAGWTAAGILVILIAKGIIEAIKALVGTI